MTRPQNHTIAVLIMSLSMFLIGIGDAVVRFLGETIPVGQLVFVRGGLVVVMLVVVMRLMRDALRLACLGNKWSLIRGVAETTATFAFFTSIQLIPIALAVTVVFVFPVLLTLASMLFLGERVGVFRLSAVMLGFIGVIVVAAPTDAGFNLALIYPLISAVSLVVRDLVTRKIPDSISPVAITLTGAGVAAVAGAMTLPFIGWVAIAPSLYGLFIAASALVAGAFITYVIAIRRGALSVLAPTQYMVILWALLWGLLFWNEIPDTRAFIGGGLIILAGMVILWREHQLGIKRRTKFAPTLKFAPTPPRRP